MTFDVEANGRRRLVEARRAPGGWLVRLDGRELIVDVAMIGDRWSLLIGPPEGGPYDDGPPEGGPHSYASYEVSIDRRGRSERLVHVNGRAIPVSLVDPRAVFSRRRDGHAAGAAGVTPIEAPMAGRVVKVLVRAGDAVAAHQPLVIVEAMKMENELRAPGAGTVREVRAAEGASIEAGAVLVVLE